LNDRSPYQNLPGTAFWRSAVVDSSPAEMTGIYSKKFDISSDTKIATAGSCFAQHITRHLKRNGYNVLDLEPAPAWLPPTLHNKYGFSVYSARYGNIYTVHQLLQLAKEANEEFEPADICWERDERFFDALRPAIEPDGLETSDEVRFHRKYHVEKVYEMLYSMDLLIFTLGLTEAWIHRKSGTVYPTAPGVLAGAFDDAEYAFVNYGFSAVQQAFDEFIGVLGRIRAGRPSPKILLTVSPVPLTATASGRHVLQATTYSKAVLTAFAREAATEQQHIDYFPSYEIITNQAARGTFFEENLRSIKSEGVGAVMKIFFQSHNLRKDSTPYERPAAEPISAARGSGERNATSDDGLECEEAILEAFAK